MAFIGSKFCWLDYDDTYAGFAWLTANPTADSIFDAPTFAWFKLLHDTYGAILMCPVFYESGAFNLSQIPATWKNEFEQNSHWLRFTFHSRATNYTYPDPSLGSSWTNASYYAGGTSRDQSADFIEMHNEMVRFAGKAWWPRIIVAHVINGRAVDMAEIETFLGYRPVWVSFPAIIWHAWNFDYYFSSSTSPGFRSAISSTGYYQDTVRDNRLFIPSTVYPDYGFDDDTFETFSAQLATVAAARRNMFCVLSHEYYSVNGTVQQFYEDACSWLNSNGYTWRFPDENMVRYANGLSGGVPTSVAKPSGANFSSEQAVVLESDCIGSGTIYYTVDGSTPTESSPTYSTPLTIPADQQTTVKFFAKDAGGLSGPVVTETYTISASDTTAPVAALTLGAPIGLTVPVTLTATDDVGVTGYLVTEVDTPPEAEDAGWSGTAPGSFTFSTPGNKTLYAWAKDAAGNVSAGVSAGVVVTAGGGTFTISDAASASYADNITLSLASTGTLWPIRSFDGTSTRTLTAGAIKRNVGGSWQ